MSIHEPESSSHGIEVFLNYPTEEEVDSFVDDSANVEEVIDRLAERTLPSSAYDSSTIVANPHRGNLEAKFWPWNRTANRFLRIKQNPQAALEVWSAMYLSFLSLQEEFKQRLHKGMALCNIGFALGKIQGNRDLQLKSWLLGLIEDTLTNSASAAEQKNFTNAASMKGVSESILLQLIAAVESRFVSESITPLLPERSIELWLNPTSIAPSKECVHATTKLISSIGSDVRGNHWGRIQEAWASFKLPSELSRG